MLLKKLHKLIGTRTLWMIRVSGRRCRDVCRLCSTSLCNEYKPACIHELRRNPLRNYMYIPNAAKKN